MSTKIIRKFLLTLSENFYLSRVHEIFVRVILMQLIKRRIILRDCLNMTESMYRQRFMKTVTKYKLLDVALGFILAIFIINLIELLQKVCAEIQTS